MTGLQTEYSQFIHLSRYARYNHELKRRETWSETVDRYVDFFRQHLTAYGMPADDSIYDEVREAIYQCRILPSMRCLMSAGPALKLHNMSGYNCTYLAINRTACFREIMYILMCGSGVGFSVERQFICHLPVVPNELVNHDATIVVGDSKEEWAMSYDRLINLLYEGKVPKWDVSLVRPAGSVLKTIGGRASGPAPLIELFQFTINMFRNARGRKLRSIEVHDIITKLGDIVVVGGVRRSALISLSNLSDDRMRHAKSGNWWDLYPHRALANNSVCYTEKPNAECFMEEWLSLMKSKSGERGIFNRKSAQSHVATLGRRDPNHDFGTNPCSEIILRDCQTCNLSTIIVRSDDTEESLIDKIRLATVIGTWQSTLNDFHPVLSSKWGENNREERLLGVSMTGIFDNPITSAAAIAAGTVGTIGAMDRLKSLLTYLKNTAIETNKTWALKLGINPSAAITCVKPEGTASQLVDSASGIHPRFSEYYVRTVRGSVLDPLVQMMQKQGFPNEPERFHPETTVVFSFPVRSPQHCVTRKNLTAIQHLELWKTYQEYYCEHKPSVTINVKDDEWLEVGAWVYRHFDKISGISFLPYSDHIYEQAPYQECSEQTYRELLERMPRNINWNDLVDYEKEDQTKSAKTLACTALECEIVDLV